MMSMTALWQEWRNDWISEELEYPFFEGDGSFDEWGDYGVMGDGYEVPPVFDDDQYEEEIVSGDVGKGFVDNYPNF
ncbi:hypothetical protein Tco_1426317 [Tanacetum coccineum]